MKLKDLLALTQEDVLNGDLPLDEILQNSLYYPSSWFDGGVVKYCNENFRDKDINSFVYCDYAPEEDDLVGRVEGGFRGYHVFAHRTVVATEIGAEELLPIDFEMNPEEERLFYETFHPAPQNGYCHWFVMERDEEFGEDHGPQRFSLLYVRGEGVATYVGLYLNRNVSPRVVAIIQPGHGFGGNWTNFEDTDSCLYRLMKASGAGMPEYIFNGGIGNSYADLGWPEYEFVEQISGYYYPGYGSMAIYREAKRYSPGSASQGV